MNIKKYGFDPSNIYENEKGIPARITAVHRELFEFVCDEGAGFARVKAGEYYASDEIFPTTGVFVIIDWQKDGESRILKTIPRKSYFSRLDPSSSGHKEQVVAANFDYVFIMQSLDLNFRPHILERYLTLAWQSGAIPAIVLTKSDYQDLVKDAYAELGQSEVTVTNVLTRLLRLSQLTGGFIGDDEGNAPQRISTAKMAALEDIVVQVLQEGKKMVIIARFVPEINAISKMLEKRGRLFLHYGRSKRP